MTWYQRSGPGEDVFVSTRIRLARNLQGYPLGDRLTNDMARELISKIQPLFPASEGYQFTDMATLSRTEAEALAEKHYISPDFVQTKTPHALICEESKGLSIMICEEDHVRVQCLSKGFSPEECRLGAFEAEEKLDLALPIAYDDTFGYLTHCPTNLGTGMRVSVMMFLPALTATGQMNSLSAQIQKMGLVIRGIQGEGSKAQGFLYQISNQVTLGISEAETIRKVSEVVRKIAENERKVRAHFDDTTKWQLQDKAARALGICANAKLMSTNEFFSLWADIRLGVAMGNMEGMTYEMLDTMIFELLPASMTLAITDECAAFSPEMKRDFMRAKTLRGLCKGIEQ